MARPPKTIHTARALHSLLLEVYAAGTSLARKDVDGLIISTAEVSNAQAKNILLTGEGDGLWVREGCRPGVAGFVVLLAKRTTPTTATAPLAEAPMPT